MNKNTKKTYDALADSRGGMEIQKLSDGSFVIFHAESNRYYRDSNLHIWCFPFLQDARKRMKELADGMFQKK